MISFALNDFSFLGEVDRNMIPMITKIMESNANIPNHQSMELLAISHPSEFIPTVPNARNIRLTKIQSTPTITGDRRNRRQNVLFIFFEYDKKTCNCHKICMVLMYFFNPKLVLSSITYYIIFYKKSKLNMAYL